MNCYTTPNPGNYEGIYNSSNIRRESTEVLNFLTQSVVSANYKPFHSVQAPTVVKPIVLNQNRQKSAKDQSNIDDSELRRKEKELAVKIIVEKLKDVQSRGKNGNVLQQQNYKQAHAEKNTQKVKYENEMNALKNAKKVEKDSHIQSVKMTAFNIIDENIKKAVTVAEQIKKEIDVEVTSKREENRRNIDKKATKKKETLSVEEKRAYALGLHTIPYMKSYMQSKNFSSVLVNRIFLQLTKFVVSLVKIVSAKRNIFARSQKSSGYNSTTIENEIQDLLSDEEYYEEKILSGAEMSRKFGRTPIEFTKRMDTVITEFQKRTGIEQTTKLTRRSRSRSRSNVKDRIINEEFIDNTSRDSKMKNMYRAFVTEEWSEYYDLEKPKVSQTIKSDKFIESKSIKKETIEKLIEEKTNPKECPLTYIAIVQTHVFTNQNAIIQDIKRDIREDEKHERRKITETLDSKKEKIVETKEQTASFTELEHQIIRINKEKPIEKVVVIESIEDITPVEEYKTFPAVEKVRTGVAIQKTTELLENLTEIAMEKSLNASQARQLVEPSSFSIAGIEAVVNQEEKDDTFMLPEVKPRKSVTLFEPLHKIIAGITQSDTTEPALEKLDIIDIPSTKTISSIETPIKSIAEVSEVKIINAQTKPLELIIPNENKPKELVQTPVQSVALSTETFIVQPKVAHIEISETKIGTSKVTLEPLSTTVAKKSEIYADETTETFDQKELTLEYLKPGLEPQLKMVAEKSETYFNESTETTSAAQLHTESIRETFEHPNKAVAETLETSTEITEGVYESHKLNETSIKMSIELPNKLIVQKGEISSEEVKIEELADMKVKTQNVILTLETATKPVAEINQTISSEHSIDFDSVRQNKENIFKSIEPMKSIADKLEIYVNDIGEEFDKFKAKGTEPEFVTEAPIRITAVTNETLTNEAISDVDNLIVNEEKIYIHVEPACKTVAEVCVTLSDEASGIYKKGKLGTISSQVLVETDIDKSVYTIEPPKIVAENSLVIPNEPNLDILNIEKLTTLEPKILLEETTRLLPEIIIPVLEEPKLEAIEIPKLPKEGGKIAFNKIESTIVTEMLLVEPNNEPFEVPEIKIKTPHPLVEEPLLAVPEILMISLEGPKDDIPIISKYTKEQALLDFERAEASTITEISIIEPQCEVLEVTEIKEHHHYTSLEDVKLTVSNIEQNVTLGPKDDMFVTPTIVKVSADLKIDKQKALEGSIIIAEETIDKSLEELKLDVKQPKIFVEESNKTVAENILVRAVDSEKSLRMSEATGHVASVSVQPLTSLAQTATVPLEEVRVSVKDNFHMEKDLKKVNTKIESFETFKAKINKVEVKESKVEITEMIDDKRTYEDVDYKVELAKDDIEIKKSTKKKESLAKVELNSEYIKKDIEYMENGMTSIIQSVDADLEAKTLKKSKVAISKVKIERDASKSPSPTSPINDVYLFCVATPYSKHEPEPPAVELDYKSTPKRRYTKAEISVAESIAIEYQISDSEDELESTEIKYECHLYESDVNMAAISQNSRTVEQSGVEQKIESRIEQSEYAIQKQQQAQHRGLIKSTLQSESTIIESKTTADMAANAETKASQFASKTAVEISHQSNQSTNKRKSTKSAKSKHLASELLQSEDHTANLEMTSYHSQGMQFTNKRKSTKSAKSKHLASELLQSEDHRANLEMASYHSQEMQSIDENRHAIQQDIKVIESDVVSRHSLITDYDASKKTQTAKTVQADTTETETIKVQKSSRHSKVANTAVELATVEEKDIIRSPPIEPATPLTDEYMFRLTAALPSREGSPVPRDCTSSSSSESEEEIRRKLTPHMEISIEQKIFDPPLPTPPTSPPTTSSRPCYFKPGLRGGGDTFDLTKEEILEIGRQSNLLASAIDKTIKQIEEYKSEAGIMEYAASEMSSSETRTISEYQSDNKIEVLIDKMVETSRRFSGDAETTDDNTREFIVPIVKEYSTPMEGTQEADASSNYSTKELVKERKIENKLSEQLLQSVQSMIDPNASLEERLAQMQNQIAELSKLPDIIQKTIENVKVQFEQLNCQVQQKSIEIQSSQNIDCSEQLQFSDKFQTQEQPTIEVTQVSEEVKEEKIETQEPDTEIQKIIEMRRLEAESKTNEEIMKERLSQELRIAAERLSPQLGFEGRPKTPEIAPYFSAIPKLPMSVPPELPTSVPQQLPTSFPQELPMGVPQELPMGVPPKTTNASQESMNPGSAFKDAVKPAGKIWKKFDNYDDANLEQMLSETLAPQEEIIKGNAIGVNFMKYEKPPPPLEHLQNSEVYKAIHDMDQRPLKKVELLKPAIAASDYVERLRSVSPAPTKTLIEDCEV